MPIYAYRCTACGHAQDVLRKVSDPPLNVCPACGAPTFVKQVTAAGFQLKGSGWYVTDFRDSKKPGKAATGDAAAKEGGDAAAPPAGESKANGDAAASGDAKAADAAGAKQAAPAAAPAPAPADKGRE
jgi:putative FmdB family regulatory protein